MPVVHNEQDLNKIAKQTVQIRDQAKRIAELETQLAARNPLSNALAMDGLRLAFENEALQCSTTKLTPRKRIESEKGKKSFSAIS